MFTVEQKHPKVITVRFDGISSGWSQDLLIRSDAHHDSSACDVLLEKKHLEQALQRKAGIIDCGDIFDLMCGKSDPRNERSHLPLDIRKSDLPYADAVLQYNANFYRKYAVNWLVMSPGNHETSFYKKNEVDMATALAKELQSAGSPVKVGSYEGWVRLRFNWNGTKRKSYHLWYHHGFGGSSPVTKGVGQNHRQMAALANADFIIGGHCHTQYWVTDVKYTLDHRGNEVEQRVECLRCPGYKDETKSGNGWAIEKGHPPKPRGAWWIRFFLENDSIEYSIEQAK